MKGEGTYVSPGVLVSSRDDDESSILNFNHFENIDSLTDGEVYFVFVKYNYSLFGYTDWSDWCPFVFSKYVCFIPSFCAF